MATDQQQGGSISSSGLSNSSSSLTSSGSIRPKARKLKLLPFKLVLASIRKDQLGACASALVQLLIFPTSDQRFFSYTATSDEISLVIEQKDLRLFPSDCLQFTQQIRRAIQVDEGPLGFETYGIVSSISLPLSKANVAIYYLSTFQTDCTIVDETDLDRAITALKAAGFVFSDQELEVDESNNDGSSFPSPLPSAQTQMVVSRLPSTLHLVQLPPKWYRTHTRQLLRALFFFGEDSEQFDTEGQFFSITETPAETSVVTDERIIRLFSDGVLCECKYKWKALQISEGAFGFNEGDIVSKFSFPLAEAAISIFNLSTYTTDYAMVEEKNVDFALQILQQKLNIITDDH